MVELFPVVCGGGLELDFAYGVVFGFVAVVFPASSSLLLCTAAFF